MLNADFKINNFINDLSNQIKMSTYKDIENNIKHIIDIIFDFKGANFLKQRLLFNVVRGKESINLLIIFMYDNYIELEVLLDSGGKIKFKWQQVEKSKEDIDLESKERKLDIDEIVKNLKSAMSLDILLNSMVVSKYKKISTEFFASSFTKSHKEFMETLINKGVQFV